MTGKDAFTEEEWNRVVRSPIVAGLALSIADPGGPIELSKEMMATLRAAMTPAQGDELLAAIALQLNEETQAHENPVGGFALTKDRPPGDQVLEELGSVAAIVRAKATSEEAADYGTWIVSVAQAAADAAKEGGFMGFGAERVSAGEQAMLDQVRAAVGA